jgi:hypothetical protein
MRIGDDNLFEIGCRMLCFAPPPFHPHWPQASSARRSGTLIRFRRVRAYTTPCGSRHTASSARAASSCRRTTRCSTATRSCTGLRTEPRPTACPPSSGARGAAAGACRRPTSAGSTPNTCGRCSPSSTGSGAATARSAHSMDMGLAKDTPAMSLIRFVKGAIRETGIMRATWAETDGSAGRDAGAGD